MSKRQYKTGVNRDQEHLLPARVEDYVSQGNVVRAVDAYVGTLDLSELSFSKTYCLSDRGQPAYDPGMLLKLYLYGYQQSIRSSRKLERETHRNLEVIWLVGGLRPSYKTIADFRKENAKSLRRVNRDFVLLCKKLSLLGCEEVAIDGSFFKADASKGSIYTDQKLSQQLEASGETQISTVDDGGQLKSCEGDKMTVYVAIPDSQKAMRKKGYFTLDEFTYDVEQDCYTCPHGQTLTPYGKPFQKNNKWRMRYASKSKDCRVCPSREKCFSPKSARRQIQRWEHEDVIERHKARMKQAPDVMKKRSAIVEHPFGVLKHRAGMHHFLMRGLEKCPGEFGLMVTSYNMTRVLNLIGIETFVAYCESRG